MAYLKTEEAYNAAMQRIEELLRIVTDETPTSDPRYLELDFLSDMVEEYEDIHYPMGEYRPSGIVETRQSVSLPQYA